MLASAFALTFIPTFNFQSILSQIHAHEIAIIKNFIYAYSLRGGLNADESLAQTNIEPEREYTQAKGLRLLFEKCYFDEDMKRKYAGKVFNEIIY